MVSHSHPPPVPMEYACSNSGFRPYMLFTKLCASNQISLSPRMRATAATSILCSVERQDWGWGCNRPLKPPRPSLHSEVPLRSACKMSRATVKWHFEFAATA